MKFLAVFALAAGSLAAAENLPLIDILASELDRNFKVLREKADPPPYYIAYAITETESDTIGASFGSLTARDHDRRRLLDVTVRVGDHKLDSYHSLQGQMGQFTAGVPISLDDSPNAIRQQLWRETDRCYRLAAQRLINIKTNKEVKVADLEASDDFSKEPPGTFQQLPPAYSFDAAQWEKKLRKISTRFHQHQGLIAGAVGVQGERLVKYFVNTEGTRLAHGQPSFRVTISAQTKAQDGMDLGTFDSFHVTDAKRLPSDKDLEKALDKVAEEVLRLRDAPTVEPFVGPAILSGRAAGVFFHEIFGHRVEGHRLKDDTDGQTFAKAIGTPVLPEFLSVVFDPTLDKAAGEDLNGWYRFDDEGVSARRVPVVENGILKTFLMSRTPIPSVSRSNGHGRRQAGAEVVARQSNLVVRASRTVSEKELKGKLIEEVKRQGKPYGFYFDQITGGYTNTGRRGIQAFKVIPLVVYRIYPDGREELVRGADIVGTPLASFAKIVAAGDKLDVFNGFCGAESGSVPVSAVAPSILVTELEVQKNESSRDRPPLLSAPTGGAN